MKNLAFNINKVNKKDLRLVKKKSIGSVASYW